MDIRLTQLIYYPGLNLEMDPKSEEYALFITNVLGDHLNQLLYKHRNAHLFPEVLDGQVAEIDLVEDDLQKLQEMFEAKHEHMIATAERRKEFQEQCSVLRSELKNEKQNTERLAKEVHDQKNKIAALEQEVAGAESRIADNVQKHNRLESELKKKSDQRLAEAEQHIELLREQIQFLERQKSEVMQTRRPPPPQAKRESQSGSMAEIMDQFQIVMHGCTTLISEQATQYFGSMRSAPDYAAQDVAMYEGRFMSEVNALGNTLGSFCKHMGCPPLHGDVYTSVNFAL